MPPDDTLTRLTDVIRKAFARPNLVVDRASTAADVDGWDSLAHTVLIFQVEKAFGVKLPRNRIFALKNVGGLVDLIDEVQKT